MNEILLYKKSQYFPKRYEPFGGDINVKLDLSNYAKKADIKNISHIDTSGFTLESNLASLKTEVDKLDIDKWVPVLVDLSKLSDVVKNYKKKVVYDKLVEKVNNIDTSRFVLKTKYDRQNRLKLLILVGLLKRQIIMLKLLKLRIKYQVLVG